MAKKIILYLSDMRPDAQEEEYTCPDLSRVTGRQTNEAPVKYLLNKHPDAKQVICLVSPKAKETAWERFSGEIGRSCPGAELLSIALEKEESFINVTLARVLEQVQPGDEILLETSGGLRNDVMDLLLLSRVLTYSGVKVAEAVYSNFGPKQVEDISHLIGLFDLVGGMQELTSFGSVKVLKEYYAKSGKDPAVQSLIFAMERLSDEILLCRTRKLDELMEKFNRAMEEAEKSTDPFMKALLPAFRAKFRDGLTLPGLILWCVDSNMLQQALTIYKERVPGYILDPKNGIARLKDHLPPIAKEFGYMDPAVQRFQDGVFRMGAKANWNVPWLRNNHVKEGNDDKRIAVLDQFESLLPGSWFKVLCRPERFCEITMDYYYVWSLRNMVNHGNENSQGSEQLARYISERQNRKLPDDATAKDVRNILRKCVKNLDPSMK